MMHSFRWLLPLMLALGVATPLHADLRDFMEGPVIRPYMYLEEFYSLHARTSFEGPLRFSERIRLLHLASQAPFDHPQRALAVCRTEIEYETYQYLMYFRIAFLLSKSYMDWAMQYDKEDVYWMDIRYADVLMKGYLVAREMYELSQFYWYETLRFARQSYSRRAIALEGEEMVTIQEDVQRVIHADELSQLLAEGAIGNLSERSPRFATFRNREALLDYQLGRIIAQRMQHVDEKVQEICRSNLIEGNPQAQTLCDEWPGVRDPEA